MVVPTRITNSAGATKAQIAPFSSESQQLQRETRMISDETPGYLINNAFNLKGEQERKRLKDSAKRLMHVESKRRDRASVRSSFSPHLGNLEGRNSF